MEHSLQQQVCGSYNYCHQLPLCRNSYTKEEHCTYTVISTQLMK